MTPNEDAFLRELRQLLRKHMVRLSDLAEWQGEEPAVSEWTFQGLGIVLGISTVADELKYPEE